jgi:glycosyltransferase involved in cell wall biosynthesis
MDGIQVYRVGPPRGLIQEGKINLVEYLAGVVREVNKAIKYQDIDFDIMHLHGSYGFPILFDELDRLLGRTVFKRFLGWRLCKKPILVTLHSTPSHDFPMKEPYFSEPFPSLKIRNSWVGLERIYRAEAEIVVCVDRYMANLLSSFPGDAKVFYIASGIDTELFKPMEKAEAVKLLPEKARVKIEKYLDDFLVLYIGRFDFSKGTQYLKAFAKTIPDDIKLVVAGDGDSNLLGHSDNMFQIGRVENQHVPALNNSCDAIFNPVLFIGTSRVTFEGMACGKPVVMFNSGDRYPLIHGKNGFAVSDIREAAEVIAQLRDNSELYGRISIEALRTAQENSVQNLSRRVDELYEEIVAAREGP